MKCKVDENLPREVAETLRSRGHDAQTVREEALSGSDDDRLLSVCRAESRTLLTLDTDFADIRRYEPKNTPGLIVFRLKRQDKPFLVEMTDRLCGVFKHENPNGKLWIVDEKKIRIRD